MDHRDLAALTKKWYKTIDERRGIALVELPCDDRCEHCGVLIYLLRTEHEPPSPNYVQQKTTRFHTANIWRNILYCCQNPIQEH